MVVDMQLDFRFVAIFRMVFFRDECGMLSYLIVSSMTSISHISCGNLECTSVVRPALISVRFHSSVMEFYYGWCGIMVVCFVPLVVKNVFTRRAKN